MRQMGCAYRKAWLSDAQKLFAKRKRGKSVAVPFFAYCFKSSAILHSTFYILHLEETRSTSRLKKQGSRKSQRSEIFGKRRSRLAGRTFCHWQNVDSIGERRRAQGDKGEEGARRVCGARQKAAEGMAGRLCTCRGR